MHQILDAQGCFLLVLDSAVFVEFWTSTCTHESLMVVNYAMIQNPYPVKESGSAFSDQIRHLLFKSTNFAIALLSTSTHTHMYT